MFESVVTLLGEVLACGAFTPAHDAPSEAEGSDRTGLSEADLVDRIAAVERLVNAVQAAQARDLHALAEARLAADRARAGVGDRLAGRSTPFEVGLALNVSPQAATSRLVAARRLVDHHPRLLAHAEKGGVSAWALRLVLRHTDLLDDDQCHAVDAQLTGDLHREPAMTPGALEQAARRRVAAIDPDADARRCARARADRQISIRDRVDGTATLWARLKAEESVLLWGSLDNHARGRRDDGDPRSLSTLMCDTLVERVTGIRIDPVPPPGSQGAAESAEAPGGGGATRTHTPGPDPDPWDVDVADPYQNHTSPDPTDSEPAAAGEASSVRAPVGLQVVFAASTLLGLDDEAGLLRGYGTIPAALVRHLADQSDAPVLRRLVCDPIDGRLLAMDTHTRCYKGSSRQFMCWRDQRCRLSGADIKEGDHIIPFAQGGPTSVANGQGLAKNPHVLRDHPDVGVRTARAEPGPDPQRLLGHAQLARLRGQAPDIIWTMPTGHAYRRRPPPALGHGSRPHPLEQPPDDDP